MEVLRREEFDVVLIDASLGGIGIGSVLKDIRDSSRSVGLIIALSDDSLNGLQKNRLLKNKADYCMNKFEDLSAIERIIKGSNDQNII